jgi:hypothetical protein
VITLSRSRERDRAEHGVSGLPRIKTHRSFHRPRSFHYLIAEILMEC